MCWTRELVLWLRCASLEVSWPARLSRRVCVCVRAPRGALLSSLNKTKRNGFTSFALPLADSCRSTTISYDTARADRSS